MTKKHIWYLKAMITAPATVWVVAENEEEARERFKRGAWHKVDSDYDHCKTWELQNLDYAVVKGPGINK